MLDRKRYSPGPDAGLYCGPRLRKGEVFAYVGLPQNLKDLQAGVGSGLRVHRVFRAKRETNQRVDRHGVGGVPREQKMLKGHLPMVIYHKAC